MFTKRLVVIAFTFSMVSKCMYNLTGNEIEMPIECLHCWDVQKYYLRVLHRCSCLRLCLEKFLSKRYNALEKKIKKPMN